MWSASTMALDCRSPGSTHLDFVLHDVRGKPAEQYSAASIGIGAGRCPPCLPPRGGGVGTLVAEHALLRGMVVVQARMVVLHGCKAVQKVRAAQREGAKREPTDYRQRVRLSAVT